GYTREAGVRNLEREIGALCRKVARRRAEGNELPIAITPDVVVEMLGAPKFLDEEIEERTKDPGVAIGLAWTPVVGEGLFIEAPPNLEPAPPEARAGQAHAAARRLEQRRQPLNPPRLAGAVRTHKREHPA